MQNEKKQYKVFAAGFLLIVAVVLVFFLKPFFLDWKNNQKNLSEQKANAEILKAPSVMPNELFAKVQAKSKIYLVDVSVPEDFKQGHIATSVNASVDKLDKDFFKGIGADSTADIFITNQGEGLASLASAVNKLISAGFVNAKYLRGGIAGWREQGYPLVSTGGSESDNAKVKKISIDEAKKNAEESPGTLQFLDVRDKDSFSKGHIAGALNIPLGEIETRRDEIPTLKKVVAYGSNDDESFQAAVALFDLNFFNIYQLEGSIDDWKAAGGNVEQ